MLVEKIQDIDHFKKLKPNWHHIYAADPISTIFLSWTWLSGWFDASPMEWMVLAARPDDKSPYVAFLPLTQSTTKKFKVDFIQELSLGGHPVADYNGFLCSPEYEQDAFSSFVQFIQTQMKWDRFQLSFVLDSRLGAFFKLFS